LAENPPIAVRARLPPAEHITREDGPVLGPAIEPGRHISFTRAELKSFTGATLPDLIAEGVRLLFVGINPGLRSVAVQGHFAPRGNRFYPALLRAGITDRLIDASAGLTASNPQAGPACGLRRHHRRRSRLRVITGAARSPSASGSAARACGGLVGGRGRLGSRTPASPGPPRRRTNGTCSQTQTSHRLRPNRDRRGVIPPA
jgi:hypothetical protein